MAQKDLIPVKPGECRNRYGRAGLPENREKIAERHMKKKIITEAIMKELGKVIDKETNKTVLDVMVQNVIRNASSNDRLFAMILDRVDGPVRKESELEVTGNNLGVIIVPNLAEEEDNDSEQES